MKIIFLLLLTLFSFNTFGKKDNGHSKVRVSVSKTQNYPIQIHKSDKKDDKSHNNVKPAKHQVSHKSPKVLPIIKNIVKNIFKELFKHITGFVYDQKFDAVPMQVNA